MSFSDKISYYAGDITSYTEEISEWLDDGVKEIVRKSISLDPSSISQYAKSFTSNNADDITDGHFNIAGEFYTNLKPQILSVFRNNGTDMKEVKEIPLNLKYKCQDTNSIYYATENSPVYYKESNGLIIEPTGNLADKYVEITAVVFGEVNDNLGTVTNFPTENYPYLVYFTAINVIYAKMLSFSDEYLKSENSIDADLTTIQDYITAFVDKFTPELGDTDTLSMNEAFSALNKAKQYLTDWQGDSDEFSFEKLVEEDEVEMGSTVLNGVQSNLSIASAYLNDVTSKVGMSSNYIQTIQPVIAKINQKIAKDNTTYQWLISQLGFVKEKYMAKFG